jgi:hypothetical protein
MKTKNESCDILTQSRSNGLNGVGIIILFQKTNGGYLIYKDV